MSTDINLDFSAPLLSSSNNIFFTKLNFPDLTFQYNLQHGQYPLKTEMTSALQDLSNEDNKVTETFNYFNNSLCSPYDSSSEIQHPENKVSELLQTALKQRGAKRPRPHSAKLLSNKSPGTSESEQDEALDLSLNISPQTSPPDKKGLIDDSPSVPCHATSQVKVVSARKSKSKGIKCAQCEVVCETRVDLWRHKLVHIPVEFRLLCPECPFVTEHRHHLQYHIQANHVMYKPFKCSLCPYECINKSMLNSHTKCHLARQSTNGSSSSEAVPVGSGAIVDIKNDSDFPKIPEHQKIVHNEVDNDHKKSHNNKSESFSMTWSGHLEAIIGEILKTSSPSSQESEKKINEEIEVTAETKPSTPTVLEKDATPSDAISHDDDISAVCFQNKRSRKGKPRKCLNEVADCDMDLSERLPSNEVNGVRMYECLHCSILFKNVFMFEDHIRLHRQDVPLQCQLCNFVASDFVSFFKHITTVSHIA